MDPPELPELWMGGVPPSRSSTTRARLGTATPLLKDLPLEDDFLEYTASRPKGSVLLPADVLSRPIKLGKHGVHPFLYGKKALRGIREGSGYFDVWPANSSARSSSSMSTSSGVHLCDTTAKPQLLHSIEAQIQSGLAALDSKSTAGNPFEHREERILVFREAMKTFSEGFRTYRGVLQVVISEYEDYITFLRTALEKKDGEIARSRSQLSSRCEEAVEQQRRQAAEFEAAALRISALESQLTEVRSTISEKNSIIDELESKVRQLHLEHANSDETSTHLLRRIQRLEKELYTTKRAAEGPVMELVKLNEAHKNLEERYENLKTLQEETATEGSRLKVQLAEKTRAMEDALKVVGKDMQLSTTRKKVGQLQKELEERTPRPNWSSFPIDFKSAVTTIDRTHHLFNLYLGDMLKEEDSRPAP